LAIGKVFTVTATNTNSPSASATFTAEIEVDAFSVVDLNAAPDHRHAAFDNQYGGGGLAAFIVGANGSAPLNYQWFFQANLCLARTPRCCAGSCDERRRWEISCGGYECLWEGHQCAGFIVRWMRRLTPPFLLQPTAA
jgi:hypothetical protein